ncbi:aspartate-semialdehyde dehydrogenase [Pseudomarimonas arenosa]|uniref:Aspartate-semialdehyde dehydrogenase n=1 Tax=Pseudomarimonas arenosa TaxID=2774145 RepID=A0AAW3ZPV4_9GAMM|nr:aspartate-semialdehyde dehydrogenase [Pseudomarimonas arenosa]MBD8527983.1 aspartate-semialdehyde dehydrogenase [Pseudomarimonas arenosa]
MSKRCNIAIAGATGAVGEALLEILEQRKFPFTDLIPLASERSAGSKLKCAGREYLVRDLETFDFKDIDIAFFSAGGKVSRVHAPRAAAAGAVVIDNTSEFRYDDDVPLVVAEVNPEKIADRPRGIIANPNCSTMQMLVALAPLHRAAKIERINVATYQSVSGGGRSAMEELGRQTAALLNFQDADPQRFPVQIAFNLIPQIDDFQPNGYTKEEMKLVWETRKILGDESIEVNPTAVRVPVFFGHSEAVHLELKEKLSAEEARKLIASAPGAEVVDEHKPGGYPTPVTHAAGKDPVYVGRIREDISHPRGLNLWIVADNIRKGAALNAIQIAEILVKT